MSKTSIEWSDFSTNPLRARNKETGKVGHFCVKCSPGCKNCYSSKLQTPYLTQLEFIAENRDKVDLFFEQKAIEEVLRRKKPTKFFWCDMTDMFGEWVPEEWIDQCFAAMALTPWHTHQVLTKRADRMLEYFTENHGHEARRRVQDVIQPPGSRGINEVAMRLFDGWPLPNVWLGCSVEDRQRKTRIDSLRQTPAALRFLSIEPLLEDIGTLDLRGISWAIIGGESGPGARPLDIAWVRSIINQCLAAGVHPFVKQLGAVPIVRAGEPLGKTFNGQFVVGKCAGVEGNAVTLCLKDRKGADWTEWPMDVCLRTFPEART